MFHSLCERFNRFRSDLWGPLAPFFCPNFIEGEGLTTQVMGSDLRSDLAGQLFLIRVISRPLQDRSNRWRSNVAEGWGLTFGLTP